MNNCTPTIGPATSKLLQSYKALETARELYYQAQIEQWGETNADAMMMATRWDDVAQMLKNDIADAIEHWAFSTTDTI